jgi:ATP/maltotriose-dependent transcriptional regulator MalT
MSKNLIPRSIESELQVMASLLNAAQQEGMNSNCKHAAITEAKSRLENLTHLLELHLANTSDKAPRQKRSGGISEREREVITLVAAGYSNKQVGMRLIISEQTVKNHLHNIFTKTGVKNREELQSLHLGGPRISTGSKNVPANWHVAIH